MRRAILIILIISFFGLITLASAQSCTATIGTLPNGLPSWYCPINTYITQQFQKQSLVAILVVALAFVIAGMIFIIGVAFRLDRVRNFGIGELYEAIASALIVGFFLYICAVIFGIIPGIFPTIAALNPYAYSLNSIYTTIGAAENLYTSLYNTYVTAAFYTAIVVNAHLGVASTPGGTLIKRLLENLLPTIKGLSNNIVFFFYLEPASVISGLLLNSIALLYMLYFIIVFFAAAAIPAFIVPGIIFRTILPTRALGGVLLAIGITFYIIMPTLFAISFNLALNGPSTPITNLNKYASELSALSSGGSVVSNAASPTGPIPTLIKNMTSAISTFWLMILLYPSIVIAISYAFIVQLSNFLGGVAPGISSLRKVL